MVRGEQFCRVDSEEGMVEVMSPRAIRGRDHAHTLNRHHGSTTVRFNGVDAVMTATGSNLMLDVQIGETSGVGFGGIGGQPANNSPMHNVSDHRTCRNG